MTNPERTPVIIGVGVINDRAPTGAAGLDSAELMIAALRLAEADSGCRQLNKLDWLGVVRQIAFADPMIEQRVADALPARPKLVTMTQEPSGDGPVRLLNDAANRIGAGEIEIAAVTGGEALRTATMRIKEGLPGASDLAAATDAVARPLWRRFNLIAPADVYALYENATRAAWGQTLADAQDETGAIWSNFSKVAAENEDAWIRRYVDAQTIETVTPDNRMISFPYSKLMIANGAVNQGAAAIIASLAMARRLGVPENRVAHIGAGASAHEPDDFIRRDSYASSASLTATITAALRRNEMSIEDIDHVEFYSCFPCIPKMARRVAGWPIDRPQSVYGGLTFGGGPIANPMMHAIGALVRKLRSGDGATGLIVANGGYATHSHAIVIGRAPSSVAWPCEHDVQAEADALRGPVPPLLDHYAGPGIVETYSVPYDREGRARGATIIGRTSAGARFLASVPAGEIAELNWLTGGDVEPVGSHGEAYGGEGGTLWRTGAHLQRRKR